MWANRAHLSRYDIHRPSSAPSSILFYTDQVRFVALQISDTWAEKSPVLSYSYPQPLRVTHMPSSEKKVTRNKAVELSDSEWCSHVYYSVGRSVIMVGPGCGTIKGQHRVNLQEGGGHAWLKPHATVLYPCTVTGSRKSSPAHGGPSSLWIIIIGFCEEPWLAPMVKWPAWSGCWSKAPGAVRSASMPQAIHSSPHGKAFWSAGGSCREWLSHLQICFLFTCGV